MIEESVALDAALSFFPNVEKIFSLRRKKKGKIVILQTKRLR
jgi:hypothetical protein